MGFRTLDGLAVAGKRVLVRADLNVPIHDGKISDLTRVERLSPTIRELSAAGARVIVCSHFDRPKGKRVPEFSLAPIAQALRDVLGRPVAFAEDCIGVVAEQAVAGLENGDVLVLENTRFHVGEEKNDPTFCAALAKLADIYVNDAFSVSHRAHASTAGITKFLPAYAGRLMQAELEALHAALGNPVRPVMAVVGGAKVSSKLDLLGNLVSKVDVLVIGGAMANTFLHAQGIKVGKSLVEKDMADTARRILDKAENGNCAIILPVDAIVAFHFQANAPSHAYGVDAIPDEGMMLDVGEQSIERVKGAIDGAVLALEADLRGLADEPLGWDPFFLAAAPGHPLARGKKRVTPEVLDGARVFLLDDGHCFRDQALQLCASAGAREIGFPATSLATLVQMVSASGGVTLLPSIALPVENRRGQLTVRPFAAPGPGRTLGLAWRRGSALRAPLVRIAGTMRAALSGR